MVAKKFKVEGKKQGKGTEKTFGMLCFSLLLKLVFSFMYSVYFFSCSPLHNFLSSCFIFLIIFFDTILLIPPPPPPLFFIKENLWLQVQEGLLKYFVHASIIVVQIPAEKEAENVVKAIHYLKQLENSIDRRV